MRGAGAAPIRCSPGSRCGSRELFPIRRAARSAPAVAPPARWRLFRARVANVYRALAAGQEQTCDDSEPDTTDAFMEAIAANSCDGTAVNATCAHTCISGYVNGSVTCSSAPAAEGEEATSFFEVVPCVGSSGGACQVLHALLSGPCPAARYSIARAWAVPCRAQGGQGRVGGGGPR